ncbi:MAG: hypothetical protein JXA90_10610 [Planctomycetes bacterium]|nr:hypothetical protein [Planctomycetota bacterium]
MILVVILGIALMVLAAVSLQMTLAHSLQDRVQREDFLARQIAESAMAQALGRFREGGISLPASGAGSTAEWVDFSEGAFFYDTTADSTGTLTTIRAWGRVAVTDNPAAPVSTAAPDDVSWDGSGWLVRGLEVTVQSSTYLPQSPFYFGNGGIEKPLGGFQWASGVDPADESTWVPVASSPSSYQASWVPLQVSALDHPVDYIQNGGSPLPVSASPHPYSIFTAQNTVGQFSTEAWFLSSAGSASDPTINVTPPPHAACYDNSDKKAAAYPYPIDSSAPDVQSFLTNLWHRHKDDPSAVKLTGGSHAGQYGDLTAPGIAFVTGQLTVPPGQFFKGAGILAIRDDYDPDVDSNNTPSLKASLDVQGTLEWTGLVIVAGWAPTVQVATGGDVTIVGGLLAEDSVQSGGEVSLDSATVTIIVNDDMRLLYSSGVFEPGGLIFPLMPVVSNKVIGVREL